MHAYLRNLLLPYIVGSVDHHVSMLYLNYFYFHTSLGSVDHFKLPKGLKVTASQCLLRVDWIWEYILRFGLSVTVAVVVGLFGIGIG